MMDTGIASRLRADGVRVVECDGWTTRGSSSFSPGGAVNHHTAGGASGSCPSLNTCINGRPDLAGPLCNVMQSREPDGNDIAYVIAAGRANHAGEGGWKGLSGNSSVYGLEIEHTGTSTLSSGRQQIAARIQAAMIGNISASMVCQHYEWAPSRKIDAATNVDANNFRNLVAQCQGGGGGGGGGGGTTPTNTLLEEGMFLVFGPGSNIYLAAPGYWSHINEHQWPWVQKIPGIMGTKTSVDTAGRDQLRALCLYGEQTPGNIN
jgi:hypothetical protein